MFTNIQINGNILDFQTANLNVINKKQSGLDLIYNQIILTPNYINVGNLSSVYNKEIILWNANYNSVFLTNISVDNLSNENLSGFSSGEIYTNTIKKYDLTVGVDGDSDINTIFHFNFVNEELTTDLNIIGSRISTFDYDINWNSSNYPVESYNHYNEIITTHSGQEQRVNYSEDTRLNIQYYYTLSDNERIKAENQIYSSGASKIQIPLHHQKTKLLSEINTGSYQAEFINIYSQFQKNSNVIIKENGKKDVLKILDITDNIVTFESQITNNYSTNAIIYPLALVYLNNNIAFNYKTNNVTNFLLTFDIVDSELYNITYNQDDYEIYDNLPLILRKETIKIDITKTFERNFEDVDFQIGFRSRFIKDKTPSIIFNHNISLFGKEEIAKTKALFNNMKGRFNEFYINSTSDDLILSESIGSLETSIKIENDGQLNFNNNVIKSIIRIELKNGNSYIRKVLNYIENTDNKISLVLDSNLGLDIEKNEVANIQYLSNARFNNDTLTINHITDEYAEISIDVKILRNP